ncbi:GNAT family N-acetyltransferase [Clostridium cylindrosporum]|uniref:Acetyltransferase n=1 Tax=Clostridium cylindrosporum DSM 605 TaxID=1121307 RepID=A0A0J8DAR0_CLOCY|nr:GNAT family N-acetyltransferase [Clostridium cylindrosporum]KMT23130.1 acetyltransferase [Clostridium cylindrosporum DSM 605]
MITKANKNNLPKIMDVLKDTIISMNTEGLYQWNENYPNEEIILNDMEKEELFVKVEDETIKGFIVLNEHDDKGYENLDWKYEKEKSLIIHRLCVSPKYQGNGVAKEIMDFTNTFAASKGYKAIRLDTAVENKKAIRFYEKLGYEKVGVLSARRGEYVCFEKNIQ